jgi:2',3'-cyclic-nucleotide 2'-phosphodiesterase
MKILFIGDVSGKPGRKVVKELLPQVKEKYKPDLVLANCENAAHGLGVTVDVLNELSSYGIDYFTSGDHVWSVRDFVESMYDLNLSLVRPYNYENQEKLPGKGSHAIDLGSKGKLLIINLVGQSFMKHIPRSPFWAVDELLDGLGIDHKGIGPDGTKQNILVDFHAETTAEKLCLAAYLQDRVSALVGTHTHVPTADARLIGDMAYVTDVGMAGPLDASLWIKFDTAIHNFKYPFKKMPEMEESGRMVFNAVLIELIEGKATKIVRVDRSSVVE